MTMGILNIAPAERLGAHLLIQLYGPPRSGKTYTALRIARGMVGPQGRIGVLDNESGRARQGAGWVCCRRVDPALQPATLPRSNRGVLGVWGRYPGGGFLLALLGG